MSELALPPGGLRADSIRIRPPKPDDTAQIEALIADPDILRFTSLAGQPGSAGAVGWLERFAAAAATGIGIGAIIADSASDEFLGTIELHEVSLKHRRAGVGYATAPAHRGRGLARDALRLFCRWAFESVGLERIEATILPDNEASLRVARAVGFQDEGVRRAVVRIDDRQHDSLALSLLSGEIR